MFSRHERHGKGGKGLLRCIIVRNVAAINHKRLGVQFMRLVVLAGFQNINQCRNRNIPIAAQIEVAAGLPAGIFRGGKVFQGKGITVV